MTNDSITLVPRYALAVGTAIALGLVGAQPAVAQFRSALDVSTRSARPGPDAWQSQLALSPFARFDHSRFSLDGRWTLYGAEGERLDGVGSASATYFSPTRAGLQLSLSGFANRDLLNETFAVSRYGTDARLSYRTNRLGVWLGREISRDNKSTPISSVPHASAGAWRQWGNAVAAVSLSAFGGQEQSFSTSRRMRPNPLKLTAPPSIADTLPDSIQVTVRDSSQERRGWNDAEVSLNWGIGRLAFRGVVGARVLTARQPNELWGQVQGTYALASDVALMASGGVHPSSAVYGVSRARFMQLGVRIAPRALLKPRLPSGVRPAAAAFEVADADRGRRTLRIRVPSARTVELSGDFTGWKPVALTRGDDDRWEATLPIAPGMHRLAIRIDGEAWTAPPGVSAVPDEFQGTVGIIIVK
jgi:hypothetical protein